ncbi:putative Transcription factor E2F3 [Hypsibius exemplaris]|uniref:Transcription factor E2F3 n=1 Tax=Hypsibius exemplaris TaxID=2072580 RepID=A0A1W0WGW0_HYPEX|nr:putative Transcription factor E2F3 [Hypsibius exemplaris]
MVTVAKPSVMTRSKAMKTPPETSPVAGALSKVPVLLNGNSTSTSSSSTTASHTLGQHNAEFPGAGQGPTDAAVTENLLMAAVNGLPDVTRRGESTSSQIENNELSAPETNGKLNGQPEEVAATGPSKVLPSSAATGPRIVTALSQATTTTVVKPPPATMQVVKPPVVPAAKLPDLKSASGAMELNFGTDFIQPEPSLKPQFKRKLDFTSGPPKPTKQVKMTSAKATPIVFLSPKPPMAKQPTLLIPSQPPAIVTSSPATAGASTASAVATASGTTTPAVLATTAPATSTVSATVKAGGPSGTVVFTTNNNTSGSKKPPAQFKQPTQVVTKRPVKKPTASVGRPSSSRASSVVSVDVDNEDDSDDSSQEDMSASRFDSSLNVITKKFFELFKTSADGIVDLNEASALLQVPKRRIYDITNVLEGIGLTKKKSKNRVEWIYNKEGVCPEEEDAGTDEERILNKALEDLEKVTLDLFRSERKNLYVRPDFLKSVEPLKNNTIICVKKRADTKLIVYPNDPRKLVVGSTADLQQTIWLVPTFLWPGWDTTSTSLSSAAIDELLNASNTTLVGDQAPIADSMDEDSALDGPEEDLRRLEQDATFCSDANDTSYLNDSMATQSGMSDNARMDSSFGESSPQHYWPLPSPVGGNVLPELLPMEPFDGLDFMFGLEFEEEGLMDIFGL